MRSRIRRHPARNAVLGLSLISSVACLSSYGRGGLTGFQVPIHSAVKGRSMRMINGGDVLIIGGGLAGLSTALELAQRGSKVVVVNRNEKESASLAAGGMLAPQAERLASGPYLDLCLQSRRMYADWAANLEDLSGGMTTGFAAAGGFLAPCFAGDGVDNWTPPPEGGPAYRLDSAQIRQMEPFMSDEVTGGWWFPEDMQVDARDTFRALKEACLRSGVSILEGEAWDVEALVFHPVNPAIKAIKLRDGRRLEFPKVVVANGAWMNKLLPIPVGPVKGQMLSLRPRQGQESPLSRVIFAENCYLIPKSDGRLIVGATVEPGVWDDKVTAKGLYDLTSKAIRIVPALGDLEVEETWSGLRPTTTDTLPVLGKTPWENLYIAGGYWRNGVLLAPRTGQLMADVVEGKNTPETSAGGLLSHFRWSRFLPKEGTGVAAPPTSIPRGPAVAPAPRSVSTPPIYSPPPSRPQQQQQQQQQQLQQPVSSSSLPMPPAAVHTEGTDVSEDDPYADYAKLTNDVDTDEILREARRINREGLVGYGLGEDAVGQEVAAKFNVPSAGMSGEWSAFEEAAKKGVQGIADYDVNYLSSRMKGLDDKYMEEDDDEEREGIEDLMMRLGYEYEDPRLGKIRAKEERRELTRRGLAPTASPPPAPSATRDIDAYEEFYCDDVRPKVGWEVKRRKEKEAQGVVEEVTAGGAYSDDPYGDYAKLRDDVEKDEIIREARRQNREGVVGYGLGEDAIGQAVSAKFNVPSAGMSNEWSQYEEAAKKGVTGIAEYDVHYLGSRMKGLDDSGMEEEEEGDSIADFMESLGYDYVDPRVAKAQAKEEARRIVKGEGKMPQASSPPQAPIPSSVPKVQTSTAPSAQPAQQKKTVPIAEVKDTAPPPPPQSLGANSPPPPWAHKIEAIYEKVRENQAAARRAKGQGGDGPESVSISFKNKPLTEDEAAGRTISREELLSKIEVFRANPDGSLTKIERGQGLPDAWQPGQTVQQLMGNQVPPHVFNSTDGHGGFQVLPRGNK